MPQASWMAMPIAGAAPLQAISEMDLAPNGPSLSSTSMSTDLKSSIVLTLGAKSMV